LPNICKKQQLNIVIPLCKSWHTVFSEHSVHYTHIR